MWLLRKPESTQQHLGSCLWSGHALHWLWLVGSGLGSGDTGHVPTFFRGPCVKGNTTQWARVSPLF